jgi:SAM-dependent methyltransferase
MAAMLNIQEHNRKAWNTQARFGIQWSESVSDGEMDAARHGDVRLHLSPAQPVPKSWLGELEGRRVLALAAGGGRQAPLLAAAGARLTLIDISEEQLARDALIAHRWHLDLAMHRCSADDLDFLQDASFDCIVLPLANCFFERLEPVWKHCARLLVPGGRLLYAFINPLAWSFDFVKAQAGIFELKYPVPYSDQKSLDSEDFKRFVYPEVPMEFGHSLSDQMGLLMREGFMLADMFEDHWQPLEALDNFFPPLINALAIRRG